MPTFFHSQLFFSDPVGHNMSDAWDGKSVGNKRSQKTLREGSMKKVIVSSIVCFATAWLALLASSAFAHPSTWGNIHTHDAKGNNVYRARPPKEVRQQNEHNRQMQDKLDRQSQQLQEMESRQSQQLREMQRMRSGY